MWQRSIPFVKICCISSVEEAKLAVRHGASALGLVSHMPSGPGVIPEDLIATIAAAVPPPIATFLLTSLQDPEQIIAQHQRCRTTTIQLTDQIPHSACTSLRKALPGIQLVQVIHVLDDQSVAEAVKIAPCVDALLLDSGNPTLAIKQLGGTGRVHNWKLSQQIVKAVTVPVFLAGGLNSANVSQAIHEVRPFGLDVCSGVRKSGKLHVDPLRAFMDQVEGTVK